MKKENKTLKNLIDEMVEKIEEDCYHFLILLSPQDKEDLMNHIRQSLIRVAKETTKAMDMRKKISEIYSDEEKSNDYFYGWDDANNYLQTKLKQFLGKYYG